MANNSIKRHSTVPMDELATPSLVSCIVAELVGTFLLVFTVGCCNFAGDPTWNASAIACILMVSVYAFAAVSGGHFNPAVSIAFGLTRKLAWHKVAFYIASQLLGGLLAAMTSCLVFEKTMPIQYVEGNKWWCACIVEMLYTGMLCFVVLNCAASSRNNPEDDNNSFFGLAIGCVLIAGGYACNGISGAAFNPAVALSVDLCHSLSHAYWGYVYTGYELLGALGASGLFMLCRPEDQPGNHLEVGPAWKPHLFRRLVSEFVGTFMLTVTVGLCIVNKSPVTALAAAASLTCMIYSLANVSGGHFNPAITAAVVIIKKEQFLDGALYVLVQMLAGIFGGVFFGLLHQHGRFSDEAFGLHLQPQWSWWGVFSAEFVFTAAMTFAMLACQLVEDTSVKETSTNFHFGLVVGSCILLGGFMDYAVSGGILNPAVSFGISTGSKMGILESTPFVNCVYFSLFQLSGATFAALVFCITHKHIELAQQ